MRDRRNDNRRAGAQILGAELARGAGSLVLRLWAKALRRPVDSLAILAAGAMTTVIIVNAAFLQSGSRTAPFFVNPTPQPANGTARPKLAEQAAAKPMPQPIPARLNDPIADLIGPSPRILAVQRILAEFGYGQIKPSGMLDGATSMAIEKFEREHKMPSTGRVSDRLVSDLATLTGQPVQ